VSVRAVEGKKNANGTEMKRSEIEVSVRAVEGKKNVNGTEMKRSEIEVSRLASNL